MRIIFVYHALAIWGGIERIWVDKMNQLVRLYGYDVYVVTYNQGSHPIPYQLEAGVRHVDLDVRTHLQYSYHGLRRLWEGYYRQRLLRQRLQQAIRDIRPDVITTTTTGELSLLSGIKGRIPLVVESHGGYDHLIEFPDASWLNRFKIARCRRLLKRADAIVTLTETDAGKWRLHYNKVYVIPNIAHLNPHGLYSSGLHQRAIVACRFAEQKGIPELIAVWRLVHQRHPDWQLDVYGEGDRSCFPDEAIGLNIHEPTSDIFSCYIDSSMLILTSRYEPFGLVIPEAMSCGLPVVAFEGDGPSSIITDGYDGYVVKHRSIETMAETICRLMDDADLRQRLGRQAIASSRRYTAEKIMPMWKDFYESIVCK